MDKKRYSCVLISDFNINNFAGYLQNDSALPIVDTAVSPFGQLMQVLIQGDFESLQTNPDLVVVWSQPENVIESYKQVLKYENVSVKEVLKEVDEYSSLLINLLDKVKIVFVPTWVYPFCHRNFGLRSMKAGAGISNVLMQMNLKLSDNLDKASGIFLLDAQRWVSIAGKNAFNPKLWYMGKIPFGNDIFIEAVKDVKSALCGISGDSKKLIILDLDDTLWGGIVGDVGWEKLRLGGHDHIGEAFIDFQRELKILSNCGILLGIVSKNEEEIALEAINKHPEMVLKLDDFAGWKINWGDKAQNIIDLVSNLNLGIQSVVFIDDNPAERERVRDALPEVLVPEWPENKMLYKSTLFSLRCFDTPSLSKEDIGRTKMYVIEQKREELKKNVDSFDEWLKGLRIKINVEELSDRNLPRTAQLLNKTNQMNLKTRRMTESELLEWLKEKNHKLWTFRVSDKFGESGLTGIISLEVTNKVGEIVDFILSCRVFGRYIEEAMLSTVVRYGQIIGLDEIVAKYIPTAKNKPCLRFLERSGLEHNADNIFIWNVNDSYKVPPYIELENNWEN